MTAKIVPTPRQVIGDQLLTALDDKSKVALIFDEKDLDLLLTVVSFLPLEALRLMYYFFLCGTCRVTIGNLLDDLHRI